MTHVARKTLSWQMRVVNDFSIFSITLGHGGNARGNLLYCVSITLYFNAFLFVSH